MSDERQWQSMAAVAVSATLTPAARSRAQRKYGTQPLHEPVQSGMASMDGGWLPEVWWPAHSANAVLAVSTKTGVSEATASYFVAAAAWALHLYGGDVTPANVMDAARMAVAWHEGAHSVASR